MLGSGTSATLAGWRQPKGACHLLLNTYVANSDFLNGDLLDDCNGLSPHRACVPNGRDISAAYAALARKARDGRTCSCLSECAQDSTTVLARG
jgi:hypothetical protein